MKEEAPIAGHGVDPGLGPAARRDRRPHGGLRAADHRRRRHRARPHHDAGVLLCSGDVDKLWGVTRNPWNTEFSPGGSSGGSARRRWRPARPRWPPARTSAARSGSRRRSAASSGSSRRTAGCPRSRSSTSTTTATRARWPGPSPTARCWRTSSPARTRATSSSLRPKLEIPCRARVDRRAADRVQPGPRLLRRRPRRRGRHRAGGRAAARRRRHRRAGHPAVATLATINRAARIHFGMIFGASIGEVYDPAQRRVHLLRAGDRRATPRRSRRTTSSPAWSSRARSTAPLGEILDAYDALVCPTFAGPCAAGRMGDRRPGDGQRPRRRETGST